MATRGEFQGMSDSREINFVDGVMFFCTGCAREAALETNSDAVLAFA